MMHRFNDANRRTIAECCGAFCRLDPDAAHAALKRAAVALILVEAEDGPDDTAFLLTRRNAGLRAHGGQWALPGGRCDPGETPIETAIRETEEEVGLALAPEGVLGILDDYATRSGYLITPVVFWAGVGAELHPNPHEVASVHRIPLTAIAPDDVVSFVTIPESDRPVVRIRIEDDHVHAPTAAMVYQFREVLAGRQTRVLHLEQPVFAWK
jgi:8-oxo-dGTP pyrophosphatase MutT (NUDIX family)